MIIGVECGASVGDNCDRYAYCSKLDRWDDVPRV